MDPIWWVAIALVVVGVNVIKFRVFKKMKAKKQADLRVRDNY